MNANPDFIERRLNTRHKASTVVRVDTGKVRKMCRSINLSATGVAIKTDDLGLTPGESVNLMFVIRLGVVIKLHPRVARVIHVSRGVTGLAMDPTVTKRIQS
jgi:hypothetical protein